MHRVPIRPPDASVWVNKKGEIIYGDEGCQTLFGAIRNCFSPVADKQLGHALSLFYDLLTGKRATATMITTENTASGDIATCWVRAEVVAYMNDDVWIAIHGWVIDETVQKHWVLGR